METMSDGIGKFLDPKAIIAQLDVEIGSYAADFGCGPGYFSLPFSKAVGFNGKVFALDVLPQALETVESKAKTSGIGNILTKRVNLEKENGSQLEAESLDWVIIKDILFQNQNKEAIAREAYRILKNQGKALVVEWDQKACELSPDAPTIGPECALRISEAELEKMFTDCGFKIAKKIDAGNFHCAFVAEK
ncbi:MAG TPA: class I SAM-dependent methyltransferase [Patescibacteria group bacterium]